MKSHTAFWRRWTGQRLRQRWSGLDCACAVPMPRYTRHFTKLSAALPKLLHLNPPSSSLQFRRGGEEREGGTCRLTAPASMANAARLFLLVAVAAALAGRSDGAWCVCRTDLLDTTLQKTLDYACGGGADCRPILQGGACFAPDTVKAHCSYAVNSFYQRNNQNPQACVFSGTAALSTNDPSGNGCTYPATPSAAATTNSGMYSPPTLGPSALNDNSAAAGVLPVAGLTSRLLILACCSLVALYLGA